MNSIVQDIQDIYWAVGIVVGAGGALAAVAGVWIKYLIRSELDTVFQRINGTYIRRREIEISQKATDHRLDEHDRRIARLETIQ